MSATSIHRTRPAMGTLFEVLLRGDDEEHLAAVADAVLDEVQRIERLLSRFDSRSEISRINRLAAKEEVQLDHEVAYLLTECFEAWHWTDGAFDITATSSAGKWRPPPGYVHLPRPLDIPGIAFHPVRRTIRFTDEFVQLDLGGIGKGYALDRGEGILTENHVHHALLHGGTSSILARGPWTISFPGSGQPTITLLDESLSYSGVNEQADIIEPATGQSLEISRSVAVIAEFGTLAEICSTSLLIGGRERANQILKSAGARAIWLADMIPPCSGSG